MREREQRLARTALLFALSGALIATAWLRIETGDVPWSRVILVLALAFVPTLAVAVSARRVWVAVLTAAVTLAACAEVFHTPVTDARPGGEHDFFGPVLGSFRDGFLNFYDTTLPFRRGDFPLMHADRPSRHLRLLGRGAGSSSPRGARSELPSSSSSASAGRRPSCRARARSSSARWRSPASWPSSSCSGAGCVPRAASPRGLRSRSSSSPQPRPHRPRRRSPRARSSPGRAGIHTTSRTRRRRPLRLELALPRDPLPEEEDDGAARSRRRARSGTSTGARRRSTTTRARDGRRPSI